MLAMAAIPKHWTANLLQIYKRNTNFQISTEPAAIASMLLCVANAPWLSVMGFFYSMRALENDKLFFFFADEMFKVLY